MATQTIIEQYIPKHLWTIIEKFELSDDVISNNSQLIQLILESKSLAETNEKQNWFNLLPIMKNEQITKLQDILLREKQKLAEINAKYEQKQAEINQKYQNIINPEAYYKAQAQARAQEEKHREKDLADADNLLAQI